MAKYWRLMGDYNAETQAYSACAGSLQTSPYTPDCDGRLVGLRVMVGQEAATSLTTNVQFRLTCSLWTPNSIEVSANGNGLCTAPNPGIRPIDFEVDQPVKAGVPITVEGRNRDATAVTVSTMIMGCFTT